MKLLIDAQLPRRMVTWFTVAGCDAIHILDLPDGNRSTDEQIIAAANQEQREQIKGVRTNGTAAYKVRTYVKASFSTIIRLRGFCQNRLHVVRVEFQAELLRRRRNVVTPGAASGSAIRVRTL